ncbi:MAG: hemerythrin [Ignavibacteria bacterium]|nr:hemerythrin [Ignavibacteria bacterium]
MKPTDILKQEHRNIERMLDVLERSVTRAQSGEEVQPQVFRDAIRFIQLYADRCHHGKEEDLLFSAMEQRGFPREAGPIAVMLFEHDQGRAHIRSMGEAVERYAQGDRGAIGDIHNHALGFVGLLRQHIQKEDHVLFPMAEHHLDRSDLERLEKEFAEVESSSESCSLKHELIALLTRLETQFPS